MQNMLIEPVSEDRALQNVRQCYTDLKKALKTQTLPVFFAYFGSFPEYLAYITEQLVKNLDDDSFNRIASSLHRDIIASIEKRLEKPEETNQWINLYQNTPLFYNFQNDLRAISLINTKLACIFIALREEIKKWAFAVKKLAYQEKRFEEKTLGLVASDDFIFETGILDKYRNIPWEKLAQKYLSPSESKKYLTLRKKYLEKKGGVSLEKNLLLDYLNICSSDFKVMMKHDNFWSLRVNLEEKVLTGLENFPQLIYSPYTVIYSLTQKYNNFYELIYLLSEPFPTLAMQRLMFSGYIMV